MEFSRNLTTEPMTGRRRAQMDGVRLVLSHLMSLATERHTQTPFPAMSDHFKPSEIEGVRVPDPILDPLPDGTYNEIELRRADL